MLAICHHFELIRKLLKSIHLLTRVESGVRTVILLFALHGLQQK